MQPRPCRRGEIVVTAMPSGIVAHSSNRETRLHPPAFSCFLFRGQSTPTNAATPPVCFVAPWPAFSCFLFARRHGCEIHRDVAWAVAKSTGMWPSSAAAVANSTRMWPTSAATPPVCFFAPWPAFLCFLFARRRGFVRATSRLQNLQEGCRRMRLHPLCVFLLRGQPSCVFCSRDDAFAKSTRRWRVRKSVRFCSVASLLVFFVHASTRLRNLQEGCACGRLLVARAGVRMYIHK